MTREGRIAAVGMFDGVHRGHRFLIDFMRREGEARGLAPTVFTFSPHPLSVIRPGSHPRLLSTPEERRQRLLDAGARYVEILDFDQDLRNMTSRDFLAMLHDRHEVRALVMGFNNHFGSDRPEGLDSYRATGRDIGVEIVGAPEYDGDSGPISSSIIRQMIARGDVAGASTALGRPYTLGGHVGGGKQLGRTIGYPTANLLPDSDDLLIPAPGVYACEATLPDGTTRPAMTNIGHRPTVDGEDGPLSIEAHLLDFTDDLYGRGLALSFVSRLRDERRFASLDELREQLGNDSRATREIFHIF
ncbi:MAG: riboflavin biosynthesis protein RibF [Pseudoflavonifractor sp.]|nr:riboflavin biosynthesis protein RibF [Pseudoflavonifractor sp.]